MDLQHGGHSEKVQHTFHWSPTGGGEGGWSWDNIEEIIAEDFSELLKDTMDSKDPQTLRQSKYKEMHLDIS